MKQILKSPILNSELKPFLSCKDYTVSQSDFTLLIDERSELVITSPRPNDDDLATYYESEDYISHTDSNRSFLDKIYQLVKNYSLKKKLKLINSFRAKEKNMLDIGAGTGDFLSVCNIDGWKVTGVEPNKKAREIAIKKLQSATSTIFESLEDLKLETQNSNPNTYDIITLWHVLEHVPNLSEYISNLKKLLKPNGTLVIAVPNYKSYDANYYKEFWAAYDVPRHLWHFSRASIDKLFQVENLKVVKTLPMKFDSFYVSLLSEKYKTGRSNFLKAFYIGFLSNSKAVSTKEYSSLIYLIKNA